MDPTILGRKYDRIAHWWHETQSGSEYGIPQIGRAIRYSGAGNALDVGCGAGGRIIHKLVTSGFKVTGIDISEEMLRIARREHPELHFEYGSITEWTTEERFNLIVAWDSIFHLPLGSQEKVLRKLCGYLRPGGIFAYTFGDAEGEHESEWHDDSFYYSSIGIARNLRVILDSGCTCRHLELDQFPQNHVFMIVRRDSPESRSSAG